MTTQPIVVEPEAGRPASRTRRGEDRNGAVQRRLSQQGQVRSGTTASAPSALLAALATALLCAPVAYHRLVFRRHEKGRLLHTANAMATPGLATVGLAVSAAVSCATRIKISPPRGMAWRAFVSKLSRTC